jgi:hypothetical protein
MPQGAGLREPFLPALLLALLLTCTTSGAAQSPAPVTPAEVVGPTCASPSAFVTDTAALVLSLSGTTAPGDRTDRVLTQLEAQALAENFQPPSQLSWPGTWIPTAPAQRLGDSVIAGGLRALLRLRVDRRGRLIAAILAQPTDVTELNAGLLAAAWRADSVSALAPTLGHDSIADALIRVDVDTAPVPDAVPLMRLKVPYTRITIGASVLREAPVWIPRLDRSMDAMVELQYVIGGDGRAIPETFRVLKSQHPELVRPVVAAIVNSTFHPARSGACPVMQLVQQRIGLSLRVGGRGPPVVRAAPEPPMPMDPAPAFRVRE